MALDNIFTVKSAVNFKLDFALTKTKRITLMYGVFLLPWKPPKWIAISVFYCDFTMIEIYTYLTVIGAQMLVYGSSIVETSQPGILRTHLQLYTRPWSPIQEKTSVVYTKISVTFHIYEQLHIFHSTYAFSRLLYILVHRVYLSLWTVVEL